MQVVTKRFQNLDWIFSKKFRTSQGRLYVKTGKNESIFRNFFNRGIIVIHL